MVDAEFGHPRLAAVYDALDADRSDLVPYVELAQTLGARRVLDVGCGTGTLAVLLAGRGHEVVGVDPAAASLAVARAKPGAGRVRWVEGDARVLPVREQDLITMTANVAQAISDPDDWAVSLRAVRTALAPGGTFAFETRDPAARAWEGWTREATARTETLPGAGEVTTWTEVTAVEWPLVRFRSTWTFAGDGAVLTSTSTLRFRSEREVRSQLRQAGLEVAEVRDAPDRPGRELVVLARPGDSP